jgi:hypothetical protein
MSRSVFLWCLPVLCFLMSPTPPLAAPGPNKNEEKKQSRAVEIRDLLNQPIKFKGIEDPRATLGDVLGYLGKEYNVEFHVMEDAFEAAGQKDVCNTPIGEKPIRAMDAATFGRVLQLVVSRLSNGASSTYIIRGDVIEITTKEAIRKEFYSGREEPFPPLVHGDFEERPLDEALRELARTSGANVMIDKQVAKTAKTPVTAEFSNVPFDTAVRLLANMVALKAVQIDNVMYVTTKENAEELRLEQERREAKGKKSKDRNDPTKSPSDTSDAKPTDKEEPKYPK